MLQSQTPVSRMEIAYLLLLSALSVTTIRGTTNTGDYKAPALKQWEASFSGFSAFSGWLDFSATVDENLYHDGVHVDDIFTEAVGTDLDPFNQGYEPETYKETACTSWNLNAEEVHLSCPKTTSETGQGPHYIYISSAFYGKKGNNQNRCSYRNVDYCTQNAVNNEAFVACQAKQECTIEVWPEYIDRCNDYSDYLEIEYTCLPADNTYNICDPDGSNNYGVNWNERSPDGFILSPNYPNNHQNHHLCECILQTKRNSKISVQLLDFELESDETGYCRWDFLEFLQLQWEFGTGRRLCGSLSRNLVIQGGQKLSLVFSSDENVRERGFWLYYYGLTASRDPAPVTIQCGAHYEDSGSGSGSGSGGEVDPSPSTDIPSIPSSSTTSTPTTTTTTTKTPVPTTTTTTASTTTTTTTTTTPPSNTITATPSTTAIGGNNNGTSTGGGTGGGTGEGNNNGGVAASSDEEDSSNLGLIVGAAVGGGALVLILVTILVGIYLCRRTPTNQTTSTEIKPESTTTVPAPPKMRPPRNNGQLQPSNDYTTLQGSVHTKHRSNTYTKIQVETGSGKVTYNKEESQMTDDVYEVIPTDNGTAYTNGGINNPNYEIDDKIGGNIMRLPSKQAPPPPPYSSRNNVSSGDNVGEHEVTYVDNHVYIKPM